MYKSFYRKVGFGLGLEDKVPSDPLKWAHNQLDKVPLFTWEGKIFSEKEMRKKYGEWVYGDRKVLRKKYKNDKTNTEVKKASCEIKLVRDFLKVMN